MTHPVPLLFFRTKTGLEPVRQWLKDLPAEDRHTISRDLERVQHRSPDATSLARSLGKNLWEVRTRLVNGRVARVILRFHDGEFLALNGFIKQEPDTTSTMAPAPVQPQKGAGALSNKKRHPHHGSSLDSFLKDEGVFEEFRTASVKEAIVCQIQEAMNEKRLTRTKLAKLMQISRDQLDRVLDPAQSKVTLHALHRAAHVLDRKLRVQLF
jgi:phage-related protein/predicted XRE-type DNA-binding protein